MRTRIVTTRPTMTLAIAAETLRARRRHTTI